MEMSVGALIRELRRREGLTQGQLAAKAHVKRSWLSHVELGRREKPEREMLEAVAVALRVSPTTLLAAAGYRVAPLPPHPARTPAEIVRELDAAIRRDQQEREQRQFPTMVYPLSDQRLSAGPGAPIDTPFAYYPREGERGHRFVWVKVSGDCMEPDIREGNIVVVDLDASPVPGKVVAAMHEGEALVKKLEQRGGDLYLVAVKKRPPIRVTGETKILGVVTFHGNWV